jgi:hypothetical protein
MSDNTNHNVQGRPDAADGTAVSGPSYYTDGKVECIDAIESATSHLTGIEAFCTANAIKYLWRWKKKNGGEDLAKARWYIDRLLERLRKEGK